MKSIELRSNHCQDVLDHDTLIGADSLARKKFTFNPWRNEYSVWKDGEVIDGGQALEELLEVYNSI